MVERLHDTQKVRGSIPRGRTKISFFKYYQDQSDSFYVELFCGTIIVMKKDELRKLAMDLRKDGLTYSEIRKSTGINIPKSTLSYWCKGVVLEKKFKNRISMLRFENIRYARDRAIVVNKLKRINYLKSIESRNNTLYKYVSDINVKKLLLAMLYLGEGAKWKSHSGLQLGNANPEVIKLYLNLLQCCYKVNRKKLTAMVSYRVDQDLTELIKFWSSVSGIPIENFYRNNPDQRTKGKATRIDYHGVCAIYGPNTEIQLELEAIARMLFMTDTQGKPAIIST